MRTTLTQIITAGHGAVGRTIRELALDRFEPRFRSARAAGRPLARALGETAVRARSDTDVILIPPIDQIMAAGSPRPGMVGNFVGGEAGRGEAGLLVQTADGVREPQNRRVEIVIQ